MKKQIQGVRNRRTFLGELVLIGLLGLMCVSGSSAAEYVVVDDFESYDFGVNLIWDTWWDYWTNDTSSEVFLETQIAHDGNSISLMYDNTYRMFGGLYGSWTEAFIDDLQIGPDWTAGGAQTLSLWFYGDAYNSATANDRMYLALNDGVTVGVSYYPDVNDIKVEQWQQWNIDLEDFNSMGLDLTNVSKIYIGFGTYGGSLTPGGEGRVYFDDIQLYLGEEPELVAVDIKPGSCPNPINTRSNGVLPVAILGAEDFDVNDIDIASIRLASVAPFRSSYLDITGPSSDDPNGCGCTMTCPDGYTDLILKFGIPELAEALTDIYGQIVKGDELELTLTGELHDGSLIEGLDYITGVGEVPNRLNKPDLDRMKKTK